MDLMERQRKLEEDYSNQGVALALAKYQADLAAGRFADTGVGRTFTLRAYKLVQEALEESCAAGTRGVGGKYRTLLREVGLDVCAVIALRTGLGLISRARTGQTIEPIAQNFIENAGMAVESEHLLRKLEMAAPGYTHRVIQSMDDARTTSPSHRRRTLQKTAKNVGVEDAGWAPTERAGVAGILLAATVDAGVFELGQIAPGNPRSWIAFRPTDVTRENLDRMSDMIKGFTIYPPMLVPPKPHGPETLFNSASYLTDALSVLSSTVRTRTRRGDHRRWIKDNMGQALYDAANKAASQPYKIDVETASLLRDLFASGVHNGVAGLPSVTPITPPPYPLGDAWDREDADQVEIHDAWKATARQAYADEIVRKSHVLAFSQTMKYLREYADDTLYFPTYFDWRGRLYFRSRVNPQSTDAVKAVLQFAEKRPLGKRGLYWLKVSVATNYGFDKKAMDTRAVWTDENMAVIRDAVARHVDSDFFRAADSHWCFYVAARELIRALDSGNPEAWESGVPVAMDATCSGMQHLSALLRDPVGGMFTNLMPTKGDEKEDIYAGVAAIAVGAIQKDKDSPEMGQFWLRAGVPRAMAKRPVNLWRV